MGGMTTNDSPVKEKLGQPEGMAEKKPAVGIPESAIQQERENDRTPVISTQELDSTMADEYITTINKNE